MLIKKKMKSKHLFVTAEQEKPQTDKKEDEREQNDDPTDLGVDAAQDVEHPRPDRDV